MSSGKEMEPAADAPKRPWYKMTSAEFYIYVVAFLCGVSIMMPINAVFSAPSYMLTYYLYATRNPNHVQTMTNFWSNVLTYYNLIGLVVCLVMEPLTLLKSFRRIPMLVRLFGGQCVLIIEIIVLMVIPAIGVSEGGAVAAICVAGFLGGLGKSIFESTVYGMFSAFPSSVTSTMMGGVGCSGVITSLIQIIIKASLPDTYDGVKTQSFIYYSLDIGIQATTFVALIMLRFNSLAGQKFGDLGGVKSKVDAGNYVSNAERQPDGRDPADPTLGEAQGQLVVNKYDPDARDDSSEGKDCTVTTVRDADGPTSNELLHAAPILSVLSSIKWMAVACGFIFLVTLFLFPTIATSAFPKSKWFATVSVFIFNVSDLFGRWSPSLKFMWPRSYSKRWIIVAASFARLIFVPLLLVYSYHYIPSEAYGYVLEVIFGFSNGYIASMALVLGPRSKGIDNDGKRFVAGTMMGIAILIGATIGTVLSIMTQTVREKYGRT